MKISRTLTFFIFLIAFVQGQNARCQDSVSVMKHVYRAFELENEKPDSAMFLSKKIITESRQLGFEKGLAYGMVRFASLLRTKGRLDSVELYLDSALNARIQLKEFSGSGDICVVLAEVYLQKGDNEKAFKALIDAVHYSEKGAETSSLGRAYRALGSYYFQSKEFELATHYLELSVKIAKENDDPKLLVDALNEQANMLVWNKEFENALSLYQEIDAIAKQNDFLETILSTNINLALVYDHLEQSELCATKYSEAFDLAVELGNFESQALILNNQAWLFIRNEEYKKAEEAIMEALPLARRTTDQYRVIRIFECAVDLYEAQDDFQNAFLFQKKLLNAKEELLDAEKIRAISEMQTRFETEKKEQQITLLHEQNKLKTTQRNLFVSSCGILLICLVALGLLYRQRQKMADKNAQIAQQKITRLLNEQEIKTYNAMIEGQEEERKRIGTDLHDRLGSMLSTVKLLFNALDQKMDKVQSENNQKFDKVNAMLDEAVVEVRRISHNLNTGVVASFGLGAALEDLCESIDKNSNIRCKLMMYGLVSRLPNNIEIAVYRMVQEVMNNVLKHAKAHKVIVQLNVTDDGLNVTVEDDGVGFDVQNKSNSGGIGLENLKVRAERLNGTYHIDSTIGKGTISIIEIPFNTNDHD